MFLPRRHSERTPRARSVSPRASSGVAVGEQPGIGGDAAAVELQLQAAVQTDPQEPVIRFTRRVLHGAAIEDAASYWGLDQI